MKSIFRYSDFIMYYSLIKSRFLFAIIIIAMFGCVGAKTASADVLGEKHTFFVNSNYDAFKRSSIPVTLKYVGTNSYIYVDDSYLNSLNSFERATFNEQVRILAQEFDENIYPKETNFWGSEVLPGIDNDPKITILLEHLNDNTGGYFDSINQYSSLQASNSNQREMVTLNAISLGTDSLKVFLAHELQHLISSNQKEISRGVSEDIWLNELRSQYSVTMVGYNDKYANSDLSHRVRTFINTPEDSLTEWPNTNLDYAPVTLFGQYLVDRFGLSILTDTLRSPFVGINSINKYLISINNSNRFVDIFADWVVINYLRNDVKYSGYGYLNPNLHNIIIPPTDNRQLSSNNANTFSYSLKPWQPVMYQFQTDFLAPENKNIKISWQGSGFKVYYTDTSGSYFRIDNGSIITPPVAGSFTLIPVNESKTENFGTSEPASQIVFSIEYTDEITLTGDSAIVDGSLIMHAGTPDVYVVTGLYKRYLAPDALKYYSLDISQARVVPESIFQSYTITNYIREVNKEKVYAVWPDGTKHWLNMTAQLFTDSHRDWNSIFIVNDLESNFYKTGPDIKN